MKKYVIAVTLAVLAGALLAGGIFLDFGNPAYTDMDGYFIQHGQEQTGGNNIVTDVVFDFRGFDTLGEATVLFTAVLGAGVALRKRKEEEDYEYE